MKYCLTIEKVHRVSVWFDAETDLDAEDQVQCIMTAPQTEALLQSGSANIEYDYALCEETGRTIIDWSR